MARKKQRNDELPSRTSNQGQKLSSGGQIDDSRRGNPEIDEDSKVPVSDLNKKEKKQDRRNPTTQQRPLDS